MKARSRSLELNWAGFCNPFPEQILPSCWRRSRGLRPGLAYLQRIEYAHDSGHLLRDTFDSLPFLLAADYADQPHRAIAQDEMDRRAA